MKEQSLRLFVANYPPAEAAGRMLDALAALALPAELKHRPTPPEQVHLTLQFIGTTSPRELPAVTESVERAASGLSAFDLTPRGLITLPERGPARLVAMETDAPATLLELQRRLAHRLARNVRKNAGDRFRPHLTLARIPGGGRVPRLEEKAGAAAIERFAVGEVFLMKSLLLPAGAQHVEVARAPLQ